MKLLFFTYEVAGKGGNFVRAFSLAKNLVARGHSVTLIASNATSTLQTTKKVIDGVEVIEAGCILPYRMRHDGTSPIQFITRLMAITHKYDAVHGFGHRPTVFLPSIITASWQKIPYVADWSDLWGNGGIATLRGGLLGTVIGYVDTALEFLAYSTAQYTTVISLLLKQKTVAFRKPETVSLLSAGCDTVEVKPLDKLSSRKRLGLPLSAPIITFLGNAHYDLDLVFSTYAKLKKTVPTLTLLVVGNKTDNLLSLVNQQPAKRDIVISGFIDHSQITPYLAASDVLLLPFRNAPINQGRFPNKLGDYLAAGRPIVVNQTADIREFIGKTEACLFADETPIAMATAVKKILSNKKLAKTLSHNARALAENKSWYRVAGELESIYQNILNKLS